MGWDRPITQLAKLCQWKKRFWGKIPIMGPALMLRDGLTSLQGSGCHLSHIPVSHLVLQGCRGAGGGPGMDPTPELLIRDPHPRKGLGNPIPNPSRRVGMEGGEAINKSHFYGCLRNP